MDLACHRRPLIIRSEARLPLHTKMISLRLQTRVPTGRDVPIAANDSFCFSLLDCAPSSHRRHCSTVNFRISTPQCADCLVAAVVHYNLSSIVGTATYTSYPATCAGTTCLYLRVPWAEVIRGPPRAFHCLTTKRGGNKGGLVAFSARGREESRCVLVWLGKSEVTALTHRYVWRMS